MKAPYIFGMAKRYGQHCPIARALDVVGERWALLIVRNLLLGPLRFTDLLAGLPGMGTRMLTDRLKNLTEAGVITTKELAAPASGIAYALTERGFGLAPALNALAAWGAPLLGAGKRADRREADAAALMLWHRAGYAKRHFSGTLQLSIGDRSYVFQAKAGSIKAHRGELPSPDATASASTADMFALLDKTLAVSRAVESGKLVISGAITPATFSEAFDLARAA
jgi:DNA-binding HxlR family transcriptional regulator